MRKSSLTEYTANSLRWFGVALVLTAALIWVGNPTKVVLFLAPYTGSRVLLIKSLVGSGIVSGVIGFGLSKVATKC